MREAFFPMPEGFTKGSIGGSSPSRHTKHTQNMDSVENNYSFTCSICKVTHLQRNEQSFLFFMVVRKKTLHKGYKLICMSFFGSEQTSKRGSNNCFLHCIVCSTPEYCYSAHSLYSVLLKTVWTNDSGNKSPEKDRLPC